MASISNAARWSTEVRSPELRPVASQWPRHEADEIAAVTRVLESGRVNSLVHGDECRAFEQEFAEFVGMPHAIAVSNGTVSLELALRALGVGPGDEVILPARSFFATASCIASVGAECVFADIEIETHNIDPASVQRMLSPRTKAVICVHLGGRPCELDALSEICRINNLFLIEDCAQAHGATYREQPVGSFGDASSFSFCTDKIMSTGGEGGMVLFRNEMAWSRAWSYKDHGKDVFKLRNPAPHPAGEFRYAHDRFGSNFRLTEMQAAIGRTQLRKLPKWTEARRFNARCLAQHLEDLSAIIVDPIPDHVGHAWYKFNARLDVARLPDGMTRSDVLSRLIALGIKNAGSGSCPDMSREAAFGGGVAPRRDGQLTNAAALGECNLIFPVDHLLDQHDMEAIATAIRHVIGE
jgi:dTDP-4-amino-4,6-dideoxygalactose transaminase